MLEFSVA